MEKQKRINIGKRILNPEPAMASATDQGVANTFQQNEVKKEWNETELEPWEWRSGTQRLGLVRQ